MSIISEALLTPIRAALDSVATDVKKILNALDSRVYHVQDIDQLKTFTRYFATAVTVRDMFRGGTFMFKSSGYTVDNGIVFPAAGGGFWVRQYSGTIRAAWYGATGDGVTDDYSAIQAAIQGAVNQKYLAGIGQLGGNVLLPLGVCAISQRLVIPDRVGLYGQGKRLSTIKPTPDFSDTILIELSNKNQVQGKKNIFHTKCKDLSINLDNRDNLLGVYSEEINEGSGLTTVAIYNIKYRGCYIFAPTPSTGFGPQNFTMYDLEFIFGGQETADSRGLVMNLNGATVQCIDNISYVGKNRTAFGAEFGNMSGFTTQKLHVEGLARGLSIGTIGPCFAFNVLGIDAQNSVTATVYFGGANDTYGYTLQGIRATAGNFAVQDFRNQPAGRQNIPGPLAIYSVGSEAYTLPIDRSIICSNTAYERIFFRIAAAAPTVNDIGKNQKVLWKITNGTLREYANDNGTIVAGPVFAAP